MTRTGRITLLNIIILLFTPLAVLSASETLWDFQYVSSIIEDTPASRIWFSANEDGSGDELTNDTISQDEKTYTVYLHSLTYGASGVKLEVSPFTGKGGNIGYAFTCSGSNTAYADVSDKSVSFEFAPWDDPQYTVEKRMWELSIAPSSDDISSAVAGAYAMTVYAEVAGV